MNYIMPISAMSKGRPTSAAGPLPTAPKRARIPLSAGSVKMHQEFDFT
jgi:hypothetical protein